MRLSVVIPTLNEAENVREAVASTPSSVEVVVADGGSTDDTPAVAARAGARVVASPRGRALQMNAGARETTGDALLFLHADGVLPEGAEEAVLGVLTDPRVVGGSFRLRIRPARPSLSAISFASNLRARYLQFPYGDQGLFMRRSAFERASGFPEIPFLEDVAMVRRLRRQGRLSALPLVLTTGPRHWERLGPLPTTVLNWSMVLLYLAGASPERLHAVYTRRRNRARQAGEARLAQPD